MGRTGREELSEWRGRTRRAHTDRSRWADPDGQKQCKSRTGWAEAELDRQYWTGKTGQAELDRLKIDRTRQAGRTGQAKDRQN
jgi:hypothetical protein